MVHNWFQKFGWPFRLCYEKILLLLVWPLQFIAMPKGVYQRGPGKKSKGPNDAGVPQKRYDRNNFNKRPNAGGATSNIQKKGASNQPKAVWIRHLADLGYCATGRAPNRAVQYILCLIASPEIHEIILRLNRNLPPDAYSPVIHLGFSAWLDLFLRLDGLGMMAKECEPVLQEVFLDISNVLADRTDLDDLLAIECKSGINYLERVNKMKDKTFAIDNKPVECLDQDKPTTGFVKFIPKVDLDIMNNDGKSKQSVSSDTMIRLTLHNCLRFPIISEMAIEWLGEEFDHGLWRSQNFSTLAPISRQAWIMIAGLNNEHLIDIEAAANNMIKLIDNEEVEFPFGTALFDKKCQSNLGITLFVKAHMAFPVIKREYNYLHRIWRSFSPYFKCNCNDSSACKDSITWFDQAIWFACNHLELVYPRLTPAGRIGAFLSYIQQHLKKPVMAHLVYLHVRDMMVRVTNKLANNPDCDIQAAFGNTKLVNVCEMMIKDRKFLLAKHGMADEDDTTVFTQATCSKHDVFMPPRVTRSISNINSEGTNSSCQLIESIASESIAYVNSTNDEASVSKGPRPGLPDKNDLKQAKLMY